MPMVLPRQCARGVVANTVGGDSHGERLALKMLQRSAVAHAAAFLERLDIQDSPRLHLHLHIARILFGDMFDVLVGEVEHLARRRRNDITAQDKGYDEKKSGGEKIGQHQAMVTYPCRHHRDNLAVARQFGSEENDRYEDKQRTEHIGIVGYERQVVVEDDLARRYLILIEIDHLLRQVEDDGDAQNQHYRKEESAEELANNIPVEFFH